MDGRRLWLLVRCIRFGGIELKDEERFFRDAFGKLVEREADA